MSALLRPLGDEIALVYGTYKSKKEVKKIVEGDELDILCSDGLNYHVVVKEAGNIGRLHFRQWSRKYDYVGSFDDLYLAKRGTFSEGISAMNTYPTITKRDSLGEKSKVNSNPKASTLNPSDPRSQNFPSGTRYPEDFLSKPRFPSSSGRKRALEEPDNTVGKLQAIEVADGIPNVDNNAEDITDKIESVIASRVGEYDIISSIIDSTRRSNVRRRSSSDRKLNDDPQQQSPQVHITTTSSRQKIITEIHGEKHKLEIHSENSDSESHHQLLIDNESSIISKNNISTANGSSTPIYEEKTPLFCQNISDKTKSTELKNLQNNEIIINSLRTIADAEIYPANIMIPDVTNNITTVPIIMCPPLESLIQISLSSSSLPLCSASLSSTTSAVSTSSSSSLSRSIPCYQSQVHRASQINYLKGILNTEKSIHSLSTAIDIVSNHPIVFQYDKTQEGYNRKQIFSQKQLLELLQARRKIDEVIHHLLKTL